jgi:hypothetical protein
VKKKFLMVLLVLVLCGVGLGFSRGWFSLTSPRDTESNKLNLNLTVDPDKMKQDAGEVRNRTDGLIDREPAAATEPEADLSGGDEGTIE